MSTHHSEKHKFFRNICGFLICLTLSQILALRLALAQGTGGTTGATGSAAPAAQNPNAISDPRTSFPFLRSPPGETQLPMPQNIQTQRSQLAPGKYAEFQSICRENLYDFDLRINRALNNDELLRSYIDLIRAKEYRKVQTQAESNRETLSETQYAVVSSLAYAHQNDFSWALQLLDTLPEKERRTRLVMTASAYVLELQSNFQESKMLLQDALKLTKDDALLEDICRLNVLDSHHKEADITCRRGISKNLKNHFIPIWLGISYREKERLKDAEKLFQDSIQIENTEFAQVCLAEVYDLMGRTDDSKKAYLSALEIVSQSVRANTGIARLYFSQRKYPEALEYFSKACAAGMNDRNFFIRAHKDLVDQKHPMAERYFAAIQKCATRP